MKIRENSFYIQYGFKPGPHRNCAGFNSPSGCALNIADCAIILVPSTTGIPLCKSPICSKTSIPPWGSQTSIASFGSSKFPDGKNLVAPPVKSSEIYNSTVCDDVSLSYRKQKEGLLVFTIIICILLMSILNMGRIMSNIVEMYLPLLHSYWVEGFELNPGQNELETIHPSHILLSSSCHVHREKVFQVGSFQSD